MSDLAPFVTALATSSDHSSAIGVVQGQQGKIHGLEHQVRSLQSNVQFLHQRLHERNPLRSIQIVSHTIRTAATTSMETTDQEEPVQDTDMMMDEDGDETKQTPAKDQEGVVLIQDEWNVAAVANPSTTRMVDLFPDHDDVHTTVGALLHSQLVVDGQTIAIADLAHSLTWTSLRFAFCDMIQVDYMYICAQLLVDHSSPTGNSILQLSSAPNSSSSKNNQQYHHKNGTDSTTTPGNPVSSSSLSTSCVFRIHLYVAPVTMEEYCAATGADPSRRDFVAKGCIYTHDETERPVSTEYMLRPAWADKPVKLAFDEGSCQAQAQFLLHHLHVPYIP